MARKEKSTLVGKLILKLFSQTDLNENQLLQLDKKLLPVLLADRTTGRNIVWGCKDYEEWGAAYAEQAEMTVAAITGEYEGIIAPISSRTDDTPRPQAKGKSDVFTPTWICNVQNNLADEPFFGRPNAFNSPVSTKNWRTLRKDCNKRGKVWFPEGRTWQDYVRLNRMEITCGEAPYLASRYNVEDGKPWPVNRRVGVLDRKLRIVSENTTNERQWLKWAYEAYRHTYGFEWQGDNLLVARENLLATFVDYYKEKFRKAPAVASLLRVAHILSWNLWQMDGLTGQIPNSIPQEFMENPLFPESNADFCRIMDWESDKEVYFVELKSQWYKPKLKFEAVVGNPPFQKTSVSDALGAPVYHLFMDLAATMGERSTVIHPARFLYDAGKTPRSWNNKVRTNPHYRLAHFFANSKDLFAGVDIKGGVAITMHDRCREFPLIPTYFFNTELSAIVKRVVDAEDFSSFSEWVYPRDLYRFYELVYIENPDLEGRQSKGHRYDVGSGAFTLFPEVLTEECPDTPEAYVQLLGRQGATRQMRWIKREYLRTPDNLDSYKVLVPKSNGNGTMGETLSSPVVATPAVGHTSTFLSIGRFDNAAEAEACLKYIKTKFARALLSSLKVTQDNSREVWQNVPQQDFTAQSDIDWQLSLAEIDAQLYDKYQLTDEERSFIESKVKPMENSLQDI